GYHVPRTSILTLVRQHPPFPREQELVQIVDAALAQAAVRSGEWLVCRPGCTQCCVGVFSINRLDVRRLQRGLADLELSAPDRASRVRERAQDATVRLAGEFPGNPVTGLLDEGEAAQKKFMDFANDEPCP